MGRKLEGVDLSCKGTCQILSSIFLQVPFPQTYASYIAGVGLRKPIGCLSVIFLALVRRTVEQELQDQCKTFLQGPPTHAPHTCRATLLNWMSNSTWMMHLTVALPQTVRGRVISSQSETGVGGPTKGNMHYASAWKTPCHTVSKERLK